MRKRKRRRRRRRRRKKARSKVASASLSPNGPPTRWCSRREDAGGGACRARTFRSAKQRALLLEVGGWGALESV
jgi:hypothetical protein